MVDCSGSCRFGYLWVLVGVVESRWAPRTSKPLRGVKTALVGSTPIHSRIESAQHRGCRSAGWAECLARRVIFLQTDKVDETSSICIPPAMCGREHLHGVDAGHRPPIASPPKRARRALYPLPAPRISHLSGTACLASGGDAARSSNQAVAASPQAGTGPDKSRLRRLPGVCNGVYSLAQRYPTE